MTAFSAAWSAAVAKFARPRFRVTMAVSSTTIASPTATAVSVATRASVVKRPRSRALGPVSDIGWAHYPYTLEEVVQVERLVDDVLDATLLELVVVGGGDGAHEEHGHLLDVRIRADAVVDLESVEPGHHDVEDEKIGVHLAHRLEHQRAVGDHHRLVALLVVDRVAEQDRDRLVVLSDDDDALSQFFCHRPLGIYRNRVEAA